MKNPWVPGDSIVGNEVSQGEARVIAGKVCSELERYPSSCWAGLGVVAIVVTNQLVVNAQPKGGASFRGTLIVSADADINGINIARIVHHEVFHLLDHGYKSYGASWPNSSAPKDFVSEAAYNSGDLEEDAAETFSFINYASSTTKLNSTLRAKSKRVLDDFNAFCPDYTPQLTNKENP